MKNPPQEKQGRRPLYPCPKCGERTRVDDSHRKNGVSFPYRYRTCLNKKCRHHFKTEERAVWDD